MTILRRTLLTLTLLSFSVGAAQSACEATPTEPLGATGLEHGAYEPIEYAGDTEAKQVGGSVFVQTVAPTDQGIDVVVMGPDGYQQVAEVQDQALFKGLLPGTYSLVATDDGLQLVVGRVEVIPGCMAPVTVTLAPLAALAYTEEDVEAYEPYGETEFGAPEEVGSDGGALGVRVVLPASGAGDEAEEVTAQISVVGPNDYRSAAEGELTLADLVPGVYAVSATATGYDVTQGVVLVRGGEAAALTLVLEPLFLEEAALHHPCPPWQGTLLTGSVHRTCGRPG